jgi:hypothetical protein
MWPKQSECRQFYGDPDTNGDGTPDAAWEAAHLVNIAPPYKMRFAWDIGREVSTIRCHKLVAHDLSAILLEISEAYEHNLSRLKDAGLDLYGGCYNFRMMRGSTRLSMHSYACAIDINPSANPLGKAWMPNAGMMPMGVVTIFERHGWVWGGRWSRPDCQHFQAASV